MEENKLEVGKIAKEQVKNERKQARTAKQREADRQKRATRMKLILKVLGIILVAELSFLAFRQVALWFDYNKLVFTNPMEVSIKFNKIVTVERREPIRLVEYVGQEELDKMVASSENPTIAEYIIRKFGPVDGIKAIAIAKAESGLRCDAVNVNTNGTADLGVFQLNTVHLKKGGNWTLANMGDCYRNIDLAHEIYSDQKGFGAWVAHNNGSYLVHLAK